MAEEMARLTCLTAVSAVVGREAVTSGASAPGGTPL